MKLAMVLSFAALIGVGRLHTDEITNSTPYRFPQPLFFPEIVDNPTNPTTVEGVELGRYLFYDPILSRDESISCASCHRQEKAFSDAPFALSKGIDGLLQKRNTMPLFNLVWRTSYFWDGKSKTLEEQIFHPVKGVTEMNLNWKEAENRIRHSEFYTKKFQAAFNGKIDSSTIAMAIAQFLKTLISYNSKYDRVLRGEAYFTEDERAGFILVNDQTKGDCLHCHPSDGSPIMTTSEFSNNGLEEVSDTRGFVDPGRGSVTGNVNDYGKFKIPSLRNVVLTGPYMHDGRFETLEEVLQFYTQDLHVSPNFDTRFSESLHTGGVRLNEEEQKQVIAFLYTLTDSVFMTNPAFSRPSDMPQH